MLMGAAAEMDLTLVASISNIRVARVAELDHFTATAVLEEMVPAVAEEVAEEWEAMVVPPVVVAEESARSRMLMALMVRVLRGVAVMDLLFQYLRQVRASLLRYTSQFGLLGSKEILTAPAPLAVALPAVRVVVAAVGVLVLLVEVVLVVEAEALIMEPQPKVV